MLYVPFLFAVVHRGDAENGENTQRLNVNSEWSVVSKPITVFFAFSVYPLRPLRYSNAEITEDTQSAQRAYSRLPTHISRLPFVRKR